MQVYAVLVQLLHAGGYHVQFCFLQFTYNNTIVARKTVMSWKVLMEWEKKMDISSVISISWTAYTFQAHSILVDSLQCYQLATSMTVLCFVDVSGLLLYPFFPFGVENGDTLAPQGDDESVGPITMATPFLLWEISETAFYVSDFFSTPVKVIVHE